MKNEAHQLLYCFGSFNAENHGRATINLSWFFIIGLPHIRSVFISSTGLAGLSRNGPTNSNDTILVSLCYIIVVILINYIL